MNACRTVRSPAGAGRMIAAVLLPSVAGLMMLFGCRGCGSGPTGRPDPGPGSDRHKAPDHAPLKVTQASPRVYYGPQPEGAAHFRQLAAAGITVVVSVDGAAPDLAAAKAAGLRYVHVPIGYGGVPEGAALALTRVMIDAGKGRVFIHCHHGRHRGPAAAAIAVAVDGGPTGEGACDLLRKAGTSPDYAGLWRDVTAFRVPAADAKLPELVETAKVSDLAAAMVAQDEAWHHLGDFRTAGWGPLPGKPDLTPAHEATLLVQHLRESRRLHSAGRPDEYLKMADDSTARAEHLAEVLRRLPARGLGGPPPATSSVGPTAGTVDDAATAKLRAEAETAYAAVGATCKVCHRRYRD